MFHPPNPKFAAVDRGILYLTSAKARQMDTPDGRYARQASAALTEKLGKHRFPTA
jgi:hypothetical protein